MANERFPKRKYVAQLRRLDRELSAWQSVYEEAAKSTYPEWLENRFIDRYRLLDAARAHLLEIIRDVELMPRLA